MSARGVLRIIEGGQVGFWCPGCKGMHAIDAAGWNFDGNYDAPTFSPSILVTGGHYIQGWKGPGCWCTFKNDHPESPTRFKCVRCHSFVRGGHIEFLSDCSHELANKTVPLEPFEYKESR